MTRLPATSCVPLVLLIVAAGIVRIVFAASLGFGVDEAYTVATSRHVALSTFDHPPLAWWIVSATRWIAHSESPLVLRLPFIALSALATWLMAMLARELYGEKAALPAALLLSAAPVLSVTTGTWILPDGPLLPALLACTTVLARLFFRDEERATLWLQAGLWGGLALLSKYHGIFLFAGTFVFLLLSRRHRHWLASPWPYAATLLALMVFAPVIVWNGEHHWVSFAFQSGRAEAARLRFWMPFVALAGQAAFLLPPVWWSIVRAAFERLRWQPVDLRAVFLLCLGSGPVLAVVVSSLWSSATLFHWAAPGYLLMIPVAANRLARLQARWPAAAAAAVAALCLVVSAVGAAPIGWARLGVPDPFRDMRPWASIDATLDAILAGLPGDTFVAGTRWHLAGRIDLALRGRARVTCLCRDSRGYGMIAPLASFKGRAAVVLVPKGRADLDEAQLAHLFASVERRDDLAVTDRGDTLMDFRVYVGRNFSGESP